MMAWKTIKDRFNDPTATPEEHNDVFARMTPEQRQRLRRSDRVEVLGSQLIFYDGRGNVHRESLADRVGAARVR